VGKKRKDPAGKKELDTPQSPSNALALSAPAFGMTDTD